MNRGIAGVMEGSPPFRLPRLGLTQTLDALSTESEPEEQDPQKLKKTTRIDDSGMLHLRCDEVSFGCLLGEEHALQRVIVGFASPLVKTTSFGLHSSSTATCARAFSMARFAGSPAQCSLEGLPNGSAKTPRMASATSGATGVLALKSKYMRGAPTGFCLRVPPRLYSARAGHAMRF